MTERLLQRSVQAEALIFASTLLHILCLNRLPKVVFPALWAAAVARLYVRSFYRFRTAVRKQRHNRRGDYAAAFPAPP
ncbi:MAG: hypothetical protein LUC21_07320 [Oscillospiraceae bacterium]|nr:hypothetical protein [Oscillospiraceae bacterium]